MVNTGHNLSTNQVRSQAQNCSIIHLVLGSVRQQTCWALQNRKWHKKLQKPGHFIPRHIWIQSTVMLVIHISNHLACLQIKLMNDLFRPTKSRLTYFIQVWLICSHPEMTTITSLLLTACKRKDLQKSYLKSSSLNTVAYFISQRLVRSWYFV